MSDYNVIVIGAGPGGYVSAIRCAQLGFKTLCIDKWINSGQKAALGGTCLNVGCIPSKALLDSSHLYETINKEATTHGIDIEPAGLNIAKMHKRKDMILSNMSKGIAGLFSKNKVDSLLGDATLIDAHTVEVTSNSSEKRKITFDNLIIASGSIPIEINQAPLGENIVDNEGALSFDKVPPNLGVVGAGVIGLELGSVWRRLGSNVTLFEMSPDFLPAADNDITKESLKIFKSQGLDIKLGVRVNDVENDNNKVTVNYSSLSDEGENKMIFDKLIVAAGRTPNTKSLELEKSGVKTDKKGFIVVDNRCRTNVSNIYAIGDVTPGPMLAHKASKDGILVAENLSGKDKSVNYKSMPWVIYTWPEIAWAGKTEQELISDNIAYKVGKFPFMANGRAHAMNCAKGMVKILSADDGLVLGIHILGPNASELIAAGVSAIGHNHSYTSIIDEIHAHPSLSEAIHEAALDIENRTIHY